MLMRTLLTLLTICTLFANSGYVFFLSRGPISWQSRTQPTTAISTKESEYMAASTATQEAFWLEYLLEVL